MRTKLAIQKPLGLLVTVLLAASYVVVFGMGTATAAAHKPATGGTCALTEIQGKPVQQFGPCKKYMPSGMSSEGDKWDTQHCWQFSEVNSSTVGLTQISCSNPILWGQAVVACPNGSPAPNNDKSKCTATTGAVCTDGSAPPCGTGIISDKAAKGNCVGALTNCDLFNQYVNPFINFLAALVGVAVVISIIYGGIQYGSSAGDPQKITAAKTRIRNALIALVTFMFLFSLLKFLLPGGLF